MALQQGDILEGKVTGITKYGAFVALPEGKSGLVHISEVANAFVSDVHEHVQIGQEVKVKVLGITPEGKINLSIKRAQEQPAPARQSYAPRRPAPAPREPAAQKQEQGVAPPSNDQSFEDKLKRFMQESDSRIADNRLYSDHPRRSRRH